MAEIRRHFQDVQEFVRIGATLREIWALILKTPSLKDFWKEAFGYQDADFRIWAFLLNPKQCKYLIQIEDYFDQDLLTIHWRDLSPLLPDSLQQSLSYLSEEFLKEGYYDQFFRKSLGAKPY
ncbi:MAG: hypothetical protein AABZ60_09200 [Planctomycetota bacterium]